MHYHLSLFVILSASIATCVASPATPVPYFIVPDGKSRYCLEIEPSATDVTRADLRCYWAEWTSGGLVRKMQWECRAEYSYSGDLFVTPDGRSVAQIRFPIARPPLSGEELKNWEFIRFMRDGKPTACVKLPEILNIGRVNIVEGSEGVPVYAIECENGIQYYSGGSAFVDDLALPTSMEVTGDDGVLIIRTIQKRVFGFRLSDGKCVLSAVSKKNGQDGIPDVESKYCPYEFPDK